MKTDIVAIEVQAAADKIHLLQQHTKDHEKQLWLPKWVVLAVWERKRKTVAMAIPVSGQKVGERFLRKLMEEDRRVIYLKNCTIMKRIKP